MADDMRIAVTLAAIDQMSGVIASATASAASRFQVLGSQVSAVSASMRNIGTGMAGAGIAMGATLALPIKQAMDFQEAMVGLGKQAGVTRLANGAMTAAGKQQYAALQGEVFRLGRTIPMVHKDIAGMMEAGARMGVATKDLAGFTTTAAKMAAAFDAAPAELAEQMAKVANVMDIPINKLGQLGDVINYLDDQSVAKGADIINVLQRVGGTAKSVNMTATQVTALASTFLGMGTPVEVTATAVNALVNKLSTATLGSKDFAAGLKTLGLNAKDVQDGMFRDAEGTIQRVLTAVNKLPQNKRVGVTTQLFGLEYGDDVTKLAGGMKQWQQNRQNAVSPQAQGSMEREFAARMTQVSSQAKLLGNAVSQAGIQLGNLFLPYVSQAIAKVTPIVNSLNKWIEANPKLTTQIGLVAAGVAGFLTVGGSLLVALGAVGGGVGMAITGLGHLATAGTKAAEWVPTVTARLSTFGNWVTAIPARLSGIGPRMATTMAGLGPALSATLTRAGFAFASFRLQASLAVGVLRGLTVSQIAGGLQTLGGSLLGRVSTGFRGAAVAARVFSVALLTNPITWVAAAVVGAGLLIYKYWQPISGFFRGFFRGLVAGASPVVAALRPMFSAIGSFVAPALGPLRSLWGAVSSLLTPVKDVGGAWETSGQRMGRAVGGMITGAMQRFSGFVSWLLALKADFWEAGANIGTAIADGIMSAIQKVTEAMSSLATKAREFLPHSPAKTGPLRDLHRLKFGETMALGIKPAPVVQAVSRVTAAARQGLNIPAGSARTAPAGGGGSVVVNFSPTFNGVSGADQAAITKQLGTSKAELERILRDIQRHQQRTGFGG